MLNESGPEVIVQIFRHEKSSKTVIILRGGICEKIYDDRSEIV